MWTHIKAAPPAHYFKPNKFVTYALPQPNTLMKGRAQSPNQILFETNRAQKKNVRSWIGRVFSNRMDKTATVVVPRMTYNSLIRKQFREFKKYKAHDEYNECRIGDIVEIHFDRKRSKTKAFIVSRIITPNRTGYEPLWPLERARPTMNPENALQPQVYLEHDIYRDDVRGLKAPYLADYVQSADPSGKWPKPTTPKPLGRRQYHPYDDHFARKWKPISDIEKRNAAAKERFEKQGPLKAHLNTVTPKAAAV
eukprot:UN03111